MSVSLSGIKLARSLHLSRRFGALYVNNPKVACSTIKLTMQRAELDDSSYTPAKSVHDHYGSPLHTFPDIDPEKALDEASFTFSFVRNPFYRLISAYLNKIVTPQKKGTFREHAGFDRSYCPTFDEFALSVCDQDHDQMNPHWRPQALNLSIGRISYDFIGQLERFDEDWAEVSRTTGLPKVASRSGARTQNWTADKPTYTNETADAVRTTFAVDFDSFGFDSTVPAA